MSVDGYRVIRSSTLAWLIERHRLHPDDGVELPEEVARDLGEAVVDVDAPIPVGDRLQALGPVLSVEEHETLLLEDPDLNLPRTREAGQFWRLVVRIVHAVKSREAEAVLRMIAQRREDVGRR